MTVHIDIVEGAVGEHHFAQGWSVTRTAVVEGISGSNVADLMQNAENAVAAVTGPRGSLCPSLSVPTYLESFSSKVKSAIIVEVAVRYKGYPLAVYEGSGEMGQVQSNLDINGDPIILTYTYPSVGETYEDFVVDPARRRNASGVGKQFDQSGLYTRQVPMPVFGVHFIVTAGVIPAGTVNGMVFAGNYNATATEVMAWLVMHQGCVNDGTWTCASLTHDAHHWMCRRVSARTRDNGVTYETDFQVQLNMSDEGWKESFKYRDPDTGDIPPDVDGQPDASPVVQVLPAVPFPTFVMGSN